MIKLPKKKYTPKQDVQLGKEAASEVRKQYPIIEDQHIAKYLTQIGNRLVAAAPTELKQSVYEYPFTPVNLKDINAFALPGGPMFVQRGMVGLGTLLLRYSRDYEKQADLPGAQLMARAGYDPRALAHAPSRSASIRLNKTATWFQMALFWSTISKPLILNG